MTAETTVGVVFGFDDVLAPDSTTVLLERNGIDPETFWAEEFQRRVTEGYDPTTAYLTALLAEIGEDGRLGRLTTDDLRAVGEELDERLFEGVEGLFEDIHEIADGYDGVRVECYVVSEGLRSILTGTSLADECTAVYGSELATDGGGRVTGVRRPLSFTDKTKCLFEINKGIERTETRRNPYAVNESVDTEDRPIPFENVVYVGDGITDVPCFSLVKERGGRVFGVFDENEQSIKQRAARDVGAPQRAENLNPPRYTESSRLGSLLRLTVEGLCAERAIDGLEAL
jgi:hypothetical protein